MTFAFAMTRRGILPIARVMPLIAVTVSDVQTKDWRSRPGSNPPVFVSDIEVEGLNEVLSLAERTSA